jgi:hypothetical protein
MIQIGMTILVLSGIYSGCQGRVTGKVWYHPMPPQYQVELKCPTGTVHEWLWADRTVIKVIK